MDVLLAGWMLDKWMAGWLGGGKEFIVMIVIHSQGPVIIYRLGWVGGFWYETNLKYLIPLKE